MRRTRKPFVAASMAGMLTVFGCADGGRTQSSPATPIAPTVPQAQTHALSGRVVGATAEGSRPVGDVRIEIAIYPPSGIFPRPGSFATAVTDAEGRYRVEDLSHGSSVVLTTPRWSRSQPCGAAATIDADTSLDIELVSAPGVPRAIQGEPAISGIVYEDTAEGRRPVADAAVGNEAVCWTGYFAQAWTRTDADGRYELCRLPSPDIIGHTDGCVTAFGKASTGQSGLLNIRGAMVVDIDLTSEYPW